MSKQSVKGVARRMKAEDKKLRAEREQSRTADSFQNFAAQLGIGADTLLTASNYGFNPITRNRTLLEWVHRGSWLGGVAVDLVANDMTRGGVSLRGELKPEDIQKIQEEVVRLRLWHSINENVRWSRLYGGSLAVMLIDGQNVETPLNVDRVGKDQFKGLVVLDRWMVEPTLNDLVTDLGSSLGLPKYYIVTTDSPVLRAKRVHYSRCLRMTGIDLPYWQKVMDNLWGISVLERLYDRMVAFDSATTGAAQLVYKAYIRTYKIKGLREINATGGKALNGMLAYVDMMRRFQSIEGITLLDAEDEFEAQQHSAFSGLSEALNQFGQQLAGALQIPLTRLFGQSPGGLNSTGESDLRTYYDGIRQAQETDLRVPVTSMYRMVAQSIGVKLPEGFRIEFNPLYQLNEMEKAELNAAVSTSVIQAESAGIIQRSTALQELKQASELTGIFTNITDEEIEEADMELPPAISEALGVAGTGDPNAPSATDMILGPEEDDGEAPEKSAEDEKGKAKDAAASHWTGGAAHEKGTHITPATQGRATPGGQHLEHWTHHKSAEPDKPKGKFEESKHARAGKGQHVGKSKGGQFVSKGQGGGAASVPPAELRPLSGAPPSTVRGEMKLAERELRIKHPDWGVAQVAAELMKQFKNERSSYIAGVAVEKDAGGTGSRAASLMRKNPNMPVGEALKRAEQKGNPEEMLGEKHKSSFWSGANELRRSGLVASGIRRKAGATTQGVVQAYQDGWNIIEIADNHGLAREGVRARLRQAGLYKEPHTIPKGGKVILKWNPDAGVPAEVRKGQQAKIYEWFQNHPDGGGWGEIARSLADAGMKANQPVQKVVAHYFNKWKKKGWLLTEHGGKPKVRAAANPPNAKEARAVRYMPGKAVPVIQLPSDADLAKVESRLTSSPVTSHKPLKPGDHTADAFLVEFKDGGKGVFKPDWGEKRHMAGRLLKYGYQAEREAGAWEVAKLAGMADLVAPTRIATAQEENDSTGNINGKRGAMMDFIPGDDAYKLGADKFDGDEDATRAALFDYVIGNEDRHAKNWRMRTGGKKICLIDHGLAFPGKEGWAFDFNVKMITHAIQSNADVSPYIAGFVQNKDKIVARLKEIGLPEDCADSVGRRIDIIAKSKDLKKAIREYTGNNAWRPPTEWF